MSTADSHPSVATPNSPPCSVPQSLRCVDVAPATVLAIELLLQEPVIDLDAAARILSADTGATMCIRRMAAEEHGGEPERAPRISDCIANLDLHELLNELFSNMEKRKRTDCFASRSAVIRMDIHLH